MFSGDDSTYFFIEEINEKQSRLGLQKQADEKFYKVKIYLKKKIFV